MQVHHTKLVDDFDNKRQDKRTFDSPSNPPMLSGSLAEIACIHLAGLHARWLATLARRGCQDRNIVLLEANGEEIRGARILQRTSSSRIVV